MCPDVLSFAKQCTLQSIYLYKCLLKDKHLAPYNLIQFVEYNGHNGTRLRHEEIIFFFSVNLDKYYHDLATHCGGLVYVVQQKLNLRLPMIINLAGRRERERLLQLIIVRPEYKLQGKVFFVILYLKGGNLFFFANEKTAESLAKIRPTENVILEADV